MSIGSPAIPSYSTHPPCCSLLDLFYCIVELALVGWPYWRTVLQVWSNKCSICSVLGRCTSFSSVCSESWLLCVLSLRCDLSSWVSCVSSLPIASTRTCPPTPGVHYSAGKYIVEFPTCWRCTSSYIWMHCHFWDHMRSLSKSVWRETQSWWEDISLKAVQSSPKRRVWEDELFPMSLNRMYMMESKGLRIDPWGTARSNLRPVWCAAITYDTLSSVREEATDPYQKVSVDSNVVEL